MSEKTKSSFALKRHSTNFTHKSQFTDHKKACENSCMMSSVTLADFLKSERMTLMMSLGLFYYYLLTIYNKKPVLQTGGVQFERRGSNQMLLMALWEM